MPMGLYVHLPFCRAKCPYCDFYSLPLSEELADRYTETLLRAIARSPWGERTADTLYCGGGTPSLLGPERLGRILAAAATALGIPADGEITLEANPGTVDRESLVALRQAGFNRISFGVQSLDDGELAALGRIHTAREARRAISAAHDAGFARISADVMLGIPGQTGESLGATLEGLAALPVDHLSAYLLKIEAGTPFAGREPELPGEDAAADLYLRCVEELEGQGLGQYEISNFAREGGASRHNLKYWQCEEYLGLGPGAHSFLEGRRRAFPRDLDAFLAAGDPFDLLEDQGEGGGAEEWAMLRLRLCAGLPLEEAARHGLDTGAILRRAAPLVREGLVRREADALSLTPRGFLLSNPVTGALLF